MSELADLLDIWLQQSWTRCATTTSNLIFTVHKFSCLLSSWSKGRGRRRMWRLCRQGNKTILSTIQSAGTPFRIRIGWDWKTVTWSEWMMLRQHQCFHKVAQSTYFNLIPSQSPCVSTISYSFFRQSGQPATTTPVTQ